MVGRSAPSIQTTGKCIDTTCVPFRNGVARVTVRGLTAIVLTLNEERHLGDCLASLRPIADRILVVDSGSTDRTRQIAENAGADFICQPFKGYASQRNAALDLVPDARWILFVDADERLTEELCEELRTMLGDESMDVAGFWIPRRNIMFGHGVKGGGWWPDFQARVIRSGRGRYDPANEVHETVIFDGPTLNLTEPLIHLNYESRREFMQKQRAYSLWRVSTSDLDPPSARSYAGRPAREFVRRFIHLRGYRDGFTGLVLASVMALEELRVCLLTRARNNQ